MKRRRGFWRGKIATRLVPAGALLAGLLVARAYLRDSGDKLPPPNAYYEVKRGDLLISVVEDGTLRAVNEVVIRNSLAGESRILQIVPEGTHVKKGDLLVELDASLLKERLNEQEVAYQDNLFVNLQARENLEIQKSLIESRVKDAELQVELAKSDLEKYRDGDAPQQIRTAEARIGILENLARISRERYERTVELHRDGNATKSELEVDSLAFTRDRINLEQAREDLRLLKKFDQPNMIRALESKLQQAKDELERLKLRSSNEIAQAEADLKTSERALQVMENALKQQQRQLDNAKIYAPQDGLVVYASSSPFTGRGFFGGSSESVGSRMRSSGYGEMFESDGRFRRGGGGGGGRGGRGSSFGSGSQFGSSGGGGSFGSSIGGGAAVATSTGVGSSSGQSSLFGGSSGSSGVASSGAGSIASSGAGGSSGFSPGSASFGGGSSGGSRGGGGGGPYGGGGSGYSGGGVDVGGISLASVRQSVSVSPSSSVGSGASLSSSSSSFSSSGSSGLGSSGSGSSYMSSSQNTYFTDPNQASSRTMTRGSSQPDERSSFFGRSSTVIAEGMMVGQRQELIKLPDISRMLVEVKIPESRVRQVSAGLRAYVKVETLPGQHFKGSVRKVALLPDSRYSWMNTSAKVYTTEVLIEDQLPELRPGVSARAEIVITNLVNVLSVPIQCVTRFRGEQVCFAKRGRAIVAVPVATGWFNDRFIEITSGLQAGDRVLLAPEGDEEIPEAESSEAGTNQVDSAESEPREELPRERGNQPPPQTRSEEAAPDRMPPRFQREESQPQAESPGARGAGEAGRGRRGRSQDDPEAQRRREEFMNLSPEERERRMREFQGRRGQGRGRSQSNSEAPPSADKAEPQ